MRRHVLIAAVGAALAAGGIAGTPAPAGAAPVFNDAESSLSSTTALGYSGPGCSQSNPSTSPDQEVPIPENGGAATVTAAASNTVQGAPGDSVAASASLSGTARVASTGDQPRSVDVAVAGQVAATSQKPVSACFAGPAARVDAYLEFTLARPVYARVELSHGGPSVGYLSLSSGPSAGLSLNVGSARSSRSLHVYLPAGSYELSYNEVVGDSTNASRQAATSTAVHIEFWAPGAATAAPAGKGLKYLTLPPTASCTGHGVDAAVTSKHKRAGKIKQVELFVDDARVAKVKHPKKGAVVHLPVAPGAAIELRTEITLEPRAKGRKPKTVTATASYEACP